ncbi:hypothetical protein AMTR_s00001p00245740, partial [Amborella trichopoda]
VILLMENEDPPLFFFSEIGCNGGRSPIVTSWQQINIDVHGVGQRSDAPRVLTNKTCMEWGRERKGNCNNGDPWPTRKSCLHFVARESAKSVAPATLPEKSLLSSSIMSAHSYGDLGQGVANPSWNLDVAIPELELKQYSLPTIRGS